MGRGHGAVIGEIEEFLTGARTDLEPDRVLATVMFTDIVGSTDRAAELGDARWRDLLGSHQQMIRARLDRFRGREIKTLGDGMLATFDGPLARSTAARPSLPARASWGSRSEPESTPVRSSCSATMSAASRSTSPPGSATSPASARCWSRARSRTCPPGPGSSSPSAANTRSRASRVSGACSPRPRPAKERSR